MFKIRGIDEKDYGPVTAEVVREWIQQRRANGQTLVQPEGTADWKPLGTLPEFAGALAAAAAPPVAGAVPASSPPAPRKTSLLAIFSLVLAILGLCSGGLTGLGGLLLGIIALVQIGKSQGRLGGKGLAIAGVCVSAVFLLLMPALLLPALAKVKSKAQAVSCVNHVKQLGLGALIYANDHDETNPPAATWCDVLQSGGMVADPKIYICPAHPKLPCGYAFNARLAGKQAGMNPGTVMFFESDAGWNASGGPELMIQKPRHGNVFIVGFADGSVQQIRSGNVGSLRWNP